MGLTWNPETQKLEDRPATCWRLSADRWTQRPITDGQLKLSEIRHAPCDQLPAAVDGRDDPHWDSTRLIVGDIASRVTPHAIWYAAPAFFGCQAIGGGWGGLAHVAGSVVTLRSDMHEEWTVSATYHEAWHVLEGLLTPAERSAVDAAVGRGGRWQTAYYDSAIERRARAFESWSMHRHEAPPAVRTDAVGRMMDAAHRWTMPAHERIFLSAFTGTIGRRAAARRWVSSSRLSPAAQTQAAADREAGSEAWVQPLSWGSIAVSAAIVVGVTVRHWLV